MDGKLNCRGAATGCGKSDPCAWSVDRRMRSGSSTGFRVALDAGSAGVPRVPSAQRSGSGAAVVKQPHDENPIVVVHARRSDARAQRMAARIRALGR